VKYKPEFVVCCMGTEVARHFGLRLEGLEDKLNRSIQMLQDTDFVGRSRKYEKYQQRFWDEFDIYEKDFDKYVR